MSNQSIKNFSSVVINQDVINSSSHFIATGDNAWRYQEFFLPENYSRGQGSEAITPSLSGLQLLVQNSSTEIDCDWIIEYQVFGSGWVKLLEGQRAYAEKVGSQVWARIDFDQEVNVTSIESSRFRFGIRSTGTLSKIWYSSPNPLATTGSAKAFAANGTTPLQPSGQDISFCFRLIALAADEGIDFLGNTFRSALITSKAENINPIVGTKDSAWYSKPNPSRFAVEALYFDVRPAAPVTYSLVSINYVANETNKIDSPATIDSLVVDPITPGVYMHVYYSTDGDVGNTENEWESKIWYRVPKAFKLLKKETIEIPQPIEAKFIKLEFTHLQAKPYTPSDFAKPVIYNKYPQWVINYFIAQIEAKNALETKNTAGRKTIIFDALDFAYNYYIDDLKQEPESPVDAPSNFVAGVSNADFEDIADANTLNKIKFVFDYFKQNPSIFAKDTNILGNYVISNISGSDITNYPFEGNGARVTSYAEIYGIVNQSVAFENDFPVMFFFLPCRHQYKKVIAQFSHNRAYFVGIKQVAFIRSRYSVPVDNTTIAASTSDVINVENNDFDSDDGVIVV